MKCIYLKIKCLLNNSISKATNGGSHLDKKRWYGIMLAAAYEKTIATDQKI